MELKLKWMEILLQLLLLHEVNSKKNKGIVGGLNAFGIAWLEARLEMFLVNLYNIICGVKLIDSMTKSFMNLFFIPSLALVILHSISDKLAVHFEIMSLFHDDYMNREC